MWRRVLGEILAASLAATACGQETLAAPRMDVPPVNQLAVAGNACGPAALLNSFQSGSDDWRRAWDGVGGKTDRERILTVIREIGMRPSRHSTGSARWSKRGVSVADLRDMAEEMGTGRYLPQPSEEVFFRQPRESPEKLLERVHQRLSKSMTKGLPPVLSIRRLAWRAEKGNAAAWVTVDAHFVTLTSLPRKLPRAARSFAVTYIDPWGGKRLSGEIRLPAQPVFADAEGRTTCLEAAFPQSAAGSRMLRRGEKSVVILAAAIGRW
jgi:hypothetical protein